ncbi:MAG: biotin/lipoyl-binding protein [Dysgonamonadaceae bacterium]|jgi:biotin carboxyl carrier protein|nr:biotin/lipoyl-binding protein [Dysgonamonadaceae bacterium]
MKSFQLKIAGKTYEVVIEEKEANTAEVSVNGKTILVEIEGETKKVSKPAVLPKSLAASSFPKPEPASTGGASSIQAPIPGNILKIEVAAGQEVKKGAVLLIMESMKMENNILAHRDGTIKTIHVKVGDNVLQGNTLVDFE